MSMRARVITASNRAAAGTYADVSGPILVEGLRALGFEVPEPVVVPDGEPVREALLAAVKEGIELVITTGGTGLTPTDHTPEVTRGVIEREIPGIAEGLRAFGAAKGVTTSWLSRGLAGTTGHTLIINVPGSSGGAKDAIAFLSPILVHAVEQVAGSDHPRTDPVE
jgi:molybdenum cofactor synthesis domain-containing protein